MDSKVLNTGIVLIFSVFMLPFTGSAQPSVEDYSNHPDFKAIKSSKEENVIVYNGKLYNVKPLLFFTFKDIVDSKDVFNLKFILNQNNSHSSNWDSTDKSLGAAAIEFKLIAKHPVKEIKDPLFPNSTKTIPNSIYYYDTTNCKNENTFYNGKVKISLAIGDQFELIETNVCSGIIQIQRPDKRLNQIYKILGHLELENGQQITFYLITFAFMDEKLVISFGTINEFIKNFDVRGIRYLILLVALALYLSPKFGKLLEKKRGRNKKKNP